MWIERIEEEFDILFEETRGKLSELDKFSTSYIEDYLSSRLGYLLDLEVLKKKGEKIYDKIRKFRQLIVVDYLLTKGEELPIKVGVLNNRVTMRRLIKLNLDDLPV